MISDRSAFKDKKKKSRVQKNQGRYFDRDLSWLSFNKRVLDEASRPTVPLMERIRFLAIYSSNLDEFYRVRMPALIALKGLSDHQKIADFNPRLKQINDTILEQQTHFGTIIQNEILPELNGSKIKLIYNEPLPLILHETLRHYFIHSVAAYIQVVKLSRHSNFFPENNKLYLAVPIAGKKADQTFIVNIPSDCVPRFHTVVHDQTLHIIFLDDVVKLCLPQLFPEATILGCHSFKITRDAELDLEDEFTGNLAKKIEKKISQRDAGLATRFLYEPGLQKQTLKTLSTKLSLTSATFVQGGKYHNLRDLANLPMKDPKFNYEQWPKTLLRVEEDSLFTKIRQKDILLHPPYHSYEAVLRFFNEAAIDPTVTKIYVTLYRVADDSRIVNALMSAAKNGKKVTVFVELKARFDEANNIKWSKKMKSAGVRIIESIPGLKVHAKLALLKRKNKKDTEQLGLIATGNFNESTARFYTDHILMTAHEGILREAEKLFTFLKRRQKPSRTNELIFKHLLVGQFNLQQCFLELIDREVMHAKNGLSSSIIIKLNNLEDKVLIERLYRASQAGVSISLFVRSICCLVPGVNNLSENISVSRIIDRYLEHGRIFIFNNNNNPEMFIGSSDWMNRNIYRRIEVCTPIYDEDLKKELSQLMHLQQQDTHQAVTLDHACNNVAVSPPAQAKAIRSQFAISEWLATNNINSEKDFKKR